MYFGSQFELYMFYCKNNYLPMLPKIHVAPLPNKDGSNYGLFNIENILILKPMSFHDNVQTLTTVLS